MCIAATGLGDGKRFCGAAILSNYFVLTANHCFGIEYFEQNLKFNPKKTFYFCSNNRQGVLGYFRTLGLSGLLPMISHISADKSSE